MIPGPPPVATITGSPSASASRVTSSPKRRASSYQRAFFTICRARRIAASSPLAVASFEHLRGHLRRLEARAAEHHHGRFHPLLLLHQLGLEQLELQPHRAQLLAQQELGVGEGHAEGAAGPS
jgi:hypothetical protein